jgi:hypothetical protein
MIYKDISWQMLQSRAMPSPEPGESWVSTKDRGTIQYMTAHITTTHLQAVTSQKQNTLRLSCKDKMSNPKVLRTVDTQPVHAQQIAFERSSNQ